MDDAGRAGSAITNANSSKGAGPTAPIEDEPSVPALRIRNLSKTFPGTLALRDVWFDVAAGEVHGLVGANGSGKSTLIKILAGVYHGDPGGTITVSGTEVPSEHTSPAKARALGLHFVHQNPAVFPNLTVAENLAIGQGFETTRLGSIRWRALRRRTQTLLERFEIPARPDTLVQSLRPAERAMVTIARALQDQEDRHSGLLVLDEPTASLPHAEVERLLGALRRFAAAGQTIILTNHHLEEIIEVASAVTVLRDGYVAGRLKGDQITEDRMIELIVGRALEQMYPEMPVVETEAMALEAKGLRGGPVQGVDFSLRRGEVLGIAGLLGSGRSEILKMIFGAYPIRAGTLELDGRPVRFRDIGDAMAAGVAYVPEDRGEGAFIDLTLSDNLVAASVSRYWRGFTLSNRSMRADARSSIGKFFIRASSERQKMGTLSGGNQQKAILARWLNRRPRILLLDDPTQGVDVGARADIYSLIRQSVAEGCSVILVTSDFEELAHLSDRVAVLVNGRITAELHSPDIDASRLTELAFTTREEAS
jgi:ribose transport system ATP-binding protein